MSATTPASRRLDIDEIAEALAKCSLIGDMRSVGALLRIAAEQLSYRSDFYGFIWVLYSAPAFILLAAYFPWVNHRYDVVWGLVAFSVALTAGAAFARFQSRTLEKTYREETQQILQLSTEALNQIVLKPSFEPEPLDMPERKFIRYLYRSEPEAREALLKLGGPTLANFASKYK